MATGWAGDGAVQDQIDATVKDGVSRAQSRLAAGPGLTHCAECGASIPEADSFSGYNRRGSKDSQLR
jgi:hypothetical protein